MAVKGNRDPPAAASLGLGRFDDRIGPGENRDDKEQLHRQPTHSNLEDLNAQKLKPNDTTMLFAFAPSCTKSLQTCWKRATSLARRASAVCPKAAASRRKPVNQRTNVALSASGRVTWPIVLTVWAKISFALATLGAARRRCSDRMSALTPRTARSAALEPGRQIFSRRFTYSGRVGASAALHGAARAAATRRPTITP